MSLALLAVLLGGALIVGGSIVYALRAAPTADVSEFLTTTDDVIPPVRKTARRTEVDVEKIRRETEKKLAERNKRSDLEARLYQAGYYNASSLRSFRVAQIASVVFCAVVFPLGIHFFVGSFGLMLMMILIGVGIGALLPLAWLSRQIEERREEVLYYLTLLIEQVSIGVSVRSTLGQAFSRSSRRQMTGIPTMQ